ncbi:MAG: EipB family protein [Alphaproteobacteria bacterium]
MPAAAAAEIVGHRAVYVLSLNHIVGDSNVADARGVFAVEWTDQCNGWAVEQSYSLHVAYHEQPDQLISSRYTTWEAKDGLTFNFEVETSRGGRRTERVQGTAELDPATHAGTALYVEPRGLEILLPEGAMFPAAHTEEMLSRAATGDILWPAVVFDGANTDQPLLINAAFGRPLEAGAASETRLAAHGPTDLTAIEGWRVRMAIFPETSSSEEADYEVQMDLLGNGVARSMRLDYRDFVLDADLRVIEPTPAPEC